MKKEKLTDEIFKQRMQEINPNVLIMGEYIDYNTKLPCKCLIDEYEWNAAPATLLKGHGCPKCGIKKYSQAKGIIKECDYEDIKNLVLNTNIPIRTIARMYGAKSADSIHRVMSSCGIDQEEYNQKNRRSYKLNIITKEIQQYIYRLYCEDRIPKSQIAKKLNYPVYTIDKILEDMYVETRIHYKHTFDECYFDNINNNNKAYLLGFLCADGCVNKNNAISFSIHSKDIEILEMYKKELQATNQITKFITKSNTEHCRISFISKHMAESLIALGCGRNKTYHLDFPKIDQKFIWHFIRGFMDGDGSIVIKENINKKGEIHKYISLYFTGTEEMMTSLKKLFNVDNRIFYYNGAYALQIGKTNDVLRILELIYKDAELFMSRKYKKYQSYLDYVEEKSKK